MRHVTPFPVETHSCPNSIHFARSPTLQKVTGIPNPQSDHAVIMVRFAKDCMVRLSQITNDLIDTLGEDTAQLKMRVGLHSGETTAGVLRGEKGRFQLFGDTGTN